MGKRPNSRVNLDRAIQRIFGRNVVFLEIRDLMANVIVGQFLPHGVVKGGSALKLRYGKAHTRVTTDLDAAYSENLEMFISELEQSLSKGWEGFTGTVIRRGPAKPAGVDPAYVMQPYSVKLAYNTQPWCTVELEVSYNEIGDADEADFDLSPDVSDIFTKLGFPEPGKIPLMPLAYQVAQKLHGASEPGSKRAHDLVDLQLIVRNSPMDYAKLRTICIRLFAYRRKQSWPPTVSVGENWSERYDAEKLDLPVLPTVDEAARWANELIAKIDSST